MAIVEEDLEAILRSLERNAEHRRADSSRWSHANKSFLAAKLPEEDELSASTAESSTVHEDSCSISAEEEDIGQMIIRPPLHSILKKEEDISSSAKVSGGQTRAPKKSVAFRNQLRVGREAGIVMTEEECSRYWYDKKCFQQFFEDAKRAAANIFDKKKQGWFSDEWKDTKATEYILHTFHTCSRAVKEEASRTISGWVHHEGLQEVYRNHDDVVGLESYVLHSVRQQSRQLCQRVLVQLNQKEGLSQEEKEMAYLDISRPSRLFAHEFAQALADHCLANN